MVTTLELQRRGLRYAVSVDAAATVASLQALDRQGLPYAVEVADGATMASRAALDARGLRYFVPVAVGATAASKASLERQGLRYAVQVDADILPADRAELERQGLRYLVEVDSSGNSVAPGAGAGVGGGALLEGETAGFATDFTHATDAERVALKSSGSTVAYAVDAFYANAGTSPKMVYNVAGTLGWSPHNLALQSQTFEHSSWDTASTTAVTADAVAAPDGTTTGDKLAEVATTNNHLVRANAGVGVTTGAVYTLSVYAKQAERTFIALSEDGSFNSYFNLATGVVGTAGSGHVLAIASAGSGWYRCSITFTTTGAVLYPYFHVKQSDGQGTYLGVAGSGIYLWGAQVNRGTTPTAYLPTTTAARVGLALDYDPVTHAAKGLLVEPQATNLLQDSNVFNTNWDIGGGLTKAQNASGPLGANTAWTLTMAAGSGNKWLYCNGPAAGTYRYSVYAKAGTLSWFSLGDGSGSIAHAAFFNVSAGTVGTVAGRASAATIEPVGNGWYRCSCTFTAAVGFFAIQPTNADNTGLTWAATGGETLLISAAQAETGSIATSFIPTSAATVTRAADLISITSASINYSATAGSWWVEQYQKILVGGARIIGCSFPNAAILIESAGTFAAYDAGYIYCFTVGSLEGNIRKIAIGFQSGSRAITEGGQAPTTDAGSTAALLAPTVIDIGGTSSGYQINGYIRKVRYLPRRMSNAELVTETT